MLFDEIFNNLTKGFYNANLKYINLTFVHLLVAFFDARKTSVDFPEKQNPGIPHSTQFMEQNIDTE